MASPAIHTERVTGSVRALLPSGDVLRGANAAVYIWVDSPELRSVLTEACDAGRESPNAWLTARTELASPSGMILDPAAARDLAILKRMTRLPHVMIRADSAGSFVVDGVPLGGYVVEAEMEQGVAIVQWWHLLDLTPNAVSLARVMGQTSVGRINLGTRDFTHSQFCTAGEPLKGAAALHP